MLNKDEMKIKGSLNVVIHHANGDVETRHKDNLILNSGFGYICAAMAEAFKKAIEAGRSAYLSGLGRTLDKGASASSPLTGFLQD